MPKLRKPPPPAILDHLLQRFREGPIGIEDFTDLKHWLGEGEFPKTFLTSGMAPKGEEVQ
jgi:hypothetical protein